MMRHMLGQVQYIDDNMRPVLWKLGKEKGDAFENHIYNIIKHELKPYFYRGLRVHKTPAKRDDGVDIFIQSPIDFLLFGVNFICKKNHIMTVAIECKSSDQRSISLEKFSKNILIHQKESPDYFVLVTNSSIAPYSYYMAANNAYESSYCFVLVDGRQLASHLHRLDAMIGEYQEVSYDDPSPFHIEYQICKGRISGKNCFELFLLIRNNSEHLTACSLQLLTDRNWAVDTQELDIVIDPHQCICKKLLVIKEHNDGIEDFALRISIDKQYKILKISNTGISYNFEPPLSGSAHQHLIYEIAQRLLSLQEPVIYHIVGEAGIGKTRVADEVYKQIADTNYKILTFLFEEKKSTQHFQTSLASQLSCASPELNAIFEVVECNPFTRYCIILEDIHNASINEFEALKDMLTQLWQRKYPIALLLIGRNDNTFYNEGYFSFCEWLASYEGKEILQREVKPLTDQECVQFIQSMILDIPKVVLDKIFRMSKNNPYYIVQFIEYLLEIKIVKLLNRNTLGIPNVKTFCRQIYIPQKIEALLTCRTKNLLRSTFGREAEDFLYILALFGLSATKDLIYVYWGLEYSEAVEYMFRSRFLTFTDQGDIRFDHETLYLFYQERLKDIKRLRRISRRIVCSLPQILEMLPPLQRGKILFHAGRLQEADVIFQPIVESIRSANNISSVNISSDYFPYLDEVYMIAKEKGDLSLQKRVLIGSVYVSIHNRDYGVICRTLNTAFDRLETDHKDDLETFTTISQLRAHAVLNTADLRQARRYFQELIAQERLAPELFTDESRFDLFDRCASLFTRYNHKAVAEKYNQLARKTAERLADPKLICLATMMQAKILFYSDTRMSLSLMEQARQDASVNMAYRINCHNNASILSASILLSDFSESEIKSLIRESKKLLEEATNHNYSFTIIRCCLTLATLYYYLAGPGNQYLALSKKYLESGINVSIRYGCEKLMNYFYGLKAMISIYERENTDITLKYFESMLVFLRKQDLLFLGSLDFCYGNIISLTNYIKFILSVSGENQLYRVLSSIHHYESENVCDFDCSPAKPCYYSCLKSIEVFKRNYGSVEKGSLVLLDSKYRYPFIDPKTGYYLAIH